MRRLGPLAVVGWLLWLGGTVGAQSPAVASPEQPVDAGLIAGEELVGKALLLRGFYRSDELNYDAAGRVQGAPKTDDWTLAGVNVQKVERRGGSGLELDGVRVAIRYNPDAHEFQRHPLNDEKVRILVADAGKDSFEAAFRAIFSIGIDPELQRSMPDFWRHYFDAGLGWPQDALTGQTIYALYNQSAPKNVISPKAEHRADAKYTMFAQRDKVQGTLQLRMVVDATGVPHRIAVARPLGYGLDEQAVEAMAKWRFSPAMLDGRPVASEVVVEQQFALLPAGR